MVAISKLITGLVLFSASAFATPLELRQVNAGCLLDTKVLTAVGCVLGCLTGKPSNLATCVAGCLKGLTDAEIVRPMLFS